MRKVILIVVMFLQTYMALADVNQGNVTYITWPSEGKLQLELETVTISATSWCSEDVGDRNKVKATIEIGEDGIGGQVDISEQYRMKFEAGGVFGVKSEFSSRFSEDRKKLYFSGKLDEGDGETEYRDQYLQLTDRLKIVGEIEWYWVDSQDVCIGKDRISGNLNI